MPQTETRLTVVIATYNRGRSLLRTLRSLARQDLPADEWEIAVVNNNSCDDTDSLVEAFRTEFPRLKVLLLHEKCQGLSYARNRGIEASHGRYIAVIDDDEEVNPGFVAAYCDFFDSHPRVAACGGRIVPLYEYDPPAWVSYYTVRPIAGQVDMGDEVKPFRGKGYPGGGNMAIRRSAIEKYGAFNPELGRTGNNPIGGEEKDLFDRLRREGQPFYYVPGAVVYHIIPREKFDDDYFDRLTTMCGVSERIRTRSLSRAAYLRALAGEGVKWGATLLFAAAYALGGKAVKGRYLMRMRRNITKGLLRGDIRRN